MTQQLVEGALNDLPHSEETREPVSAWLHSLESCLDRDDPCNTDPDIPSDRQEVEDVGYEGDSSDESGNTAPVSIIKTKTKRLGSTVSHDGPRNSHKGSTASSGGPANNRKGSTASQGGPGPSRTRKRSPAVYDTTTGNTYVLSEFLILYAPYGP